MNAAGRRRFNLLRVSSLLLVSAVSVAPAALCVWRAPDADIASMFGSGTYKTVFEDVDKDRQARIEKRLGVPLDPDETQFKFFPVYQSKKQVGTVMTHAGKGQFGAIEVVVAVVEDDSGAKVKAVRVQRDREKAKAALRSGAFLGQFNGMRANDEFRVSNDQGALKPAAKGAEKASQAVAFAVRKMLVVYDEYCGKGAGNAAQGAEK